MTRVELELPVVPPFPPMEAELTETLPVGEGWQYEPKWDGFRCLAFRDGNHVELQSKACRPLGRYFPDVVAALLRLPARRFVLDGELLIPVGGVPSFEALQLRLHPAASRVQKLAAEHEAILMAFDLLVTERRTSLLEHPLHDRRQRLERFAARCFDGARTALSPVAFDVVQARRWLDDPQQARDGVMAKRIDEPYRSGERSAMRKVKNLRAAECVIAGDRRSADGQVASLLLGLYDDDGLLHHVGFSASLDRAERRRFTAELDALVESGDAERGFSGRAPGGPSRWSRDKDTAWQPLPPHLVVEVAYDHFSGGRFRHGTRFLRRRPDKPARSCTFEQIPAAARLP